MDGWMLTLDLNAKCARKRQNVEKAHFGMGIEWMGLRRGHRGWSPHKICSLYSLNQRLEAIKQLIKETFQNFWIGQGSLTHQKAPTKQINSLQDRVFIPKASARDYHNHRIYASNGSFSDIFRDLFLVPTYSKPWVTWSRWNTSSKQLAAQLAGQQLCRNTCDSAHNVVK